MKSFAMNNRWRQCALLILACCCLLPKLASADVFNAAEFRISQGEEDNINLFAKVPTSVVNSTDLILPEGCKMATMSRQNSAGQSLLSYDFSCDRPFEEGDKIITPWYLDGATLNFALGKQSFKVVLKRSMDTMQLPLSPIKAELSKAEVIKRYLWQGMLHIWFGWDHLSFVLCLCLLAQGKNLIRLITTFTVGHSLTLALSFYEVVRVPIPPIEVLIAISIVLMSREAILVGRKERQFSATAAMGVVILFGLIHGLGFASALAELGVPDNEIGLALLFFNVGVEVGQLAFIMVLVVLYKLVSKINLQQVGRATALYGVGCLGTFWAVERLISF